MANAAAVRVLTKEERGRSFPFAEQGVVMFRQAPMPGLPRSSRQATRGFRDSRRALERQLADFSSEADRNDLQVMVEASITSAAREIDEILSGQAYARLHRSH
jgi:hypothetical protein